MNPSMCVCANPVGVVQMPEKNKKIFVLDRQEFGGHSVSSYYIPDNRMTIICEMCLLKIPSSDSKKK